MKHKTAELEGALLDAAVAKAEGQIPHLRLLAKFTPFHLGAAVDGLPAPPPYSSDWSQGGPIIERERIKLTPPEEDRGEWVAQIWRPGWESGVDVSGAGRSGTALEAAMRAFVDTKLGEEVDLP